MTSDPQFDVTEPGIASTWSKTAYRRFAPERRRWFNTSSASRRGVGLASGWNERG